MAISIYAYWRILLHLNYLRVRDWVCSVLILLYPKYLVWSNVIHATVLSRFDRSVSSHFLHPTFYIGHQRHRWRFPLAPIPRDFSPCHRKQENEVLTNAKLIFFKVHSQPPPVTQVHPTLPSSVKTR